MTTITLLGLEYSVYTRIARLALEEKNVDYVLEETDIFADDGPPASYLEKHPFGRIPCLVHDGFTLYETAAITRYIDEQFDGVALQPRDPVQRATMNQVISVLDAYAYRPMVWDVYVQRVEVPRYGGVADEAVINTALQSIETVLDQLQSWLERGGFLAGSNFSLADIHGLPVLDCFNRVAEGNRLLSRYPAILQWMDRLGRRRSVRNIMGDSKPGKPVRYNVFGNVMSVQWKDNEWQLFKETVAGIRIRVRDIAIPPDMAQSELLVYLDDMYHEYASPEFPAVVMLD